MNNRRKGVNIYNLRRKQANLCSLNFQGDGALELWPCWLAVLQVGEHVSNLVSPCNGLPNIHSDSKDEHKAVRCLNKSNILKLSLCKHCCFATWQPRLFTMATEVHKFETMWSRMAWSAVTVDWNLWVKGYVFESRSEPCLKVEMHVKYFTAHATYWWLPAFHAHPRVRKAKRQRTKLDDLIPWNSDLTKSDWHHYFFPPHGTCILSSNRFVFLWNCEKHAHCRWRVWLSGLHCMARPNCSSSMSWAWQQKVSLVLLPLLLLGLLSSLCLFENRKPVVKAHTTTCRCCLLIQ